MLTGKVKIDWRGKLTRKQVVRAVEQGMNMNLARCVQVAKSFTPVRTGILQGSIRMEPAKELHPGVVVGYFGSWDVNYALYVEKGTIYMSGRHMLQRGADQVFPKLGDDVKNAFKRRVAL